MSLLVIGIGVALLTVPALSAISALGPKERVRAACISATVGISLLVAGSLLMASPMLLWWNHQNEVSATDFGHLSPGGPWAWSAAGALGCVGLGRLVSFFHQNRSARRRAKLPSWAAIAFIYDELAGAEVRVAPTSRPFAYAVPGRDCHIVVSEPVARLAASERRAVLAHEGAHLRLRHDRHLFALGVYQWVWGWVPGVRAVVAAHQRAVEQWADMSATRHPQVELRGLLQARARLSACEGIKPEADRAEVSTEPSGSALAGVTILVATLIVAGAYSLTHTVGDVTAVIAALH